MFSCGIIIKLFEIMILYAFWLNNFQLWPEVFASVWVEDLFEVFGLPPLVNDPDEGQGSFAELAEKQGMSSHLWFWTLARNNTNELEEGNAGTTKAFFRFSFDADLLILL